MSARTVIDVPTPTGGWLHPWPNVGQIAAHVGPDDWTLVGGLMVGLHAAVRGIRLPRTWTSTWATPATPPGSR